MWYVDYNKASHVDSKVVDNLLKKNFGEIKIGQICTMEYMVHDVHDCTRLWDIMSAQGYGIENNVFY